MPGDFRTNRLFRPGPSVDLNACVGHNGGPYDFCDYSRAYLRGALALIDGADSGKLPTDLAVYPVVYCFRHGIELALKHLAVELPRLLGESGQLKMTHKLTDNWAVVRASVSRLDALDPANTVPLIDQVVTEVIDFDPNGEVFRFPVTRSGEMHLEDASIINLEVLRSEIDTTYQVFEFWDHRSDDARQAQLEGI